MTVKAKRVIYRREDGKWSWQLVVGEQVIATDGGEGYENKNQCRASADNVIGGYYRRAERRIRDLKTL